MGTENVFYPINYYLWFNHYYKVVAIFGVRDKLELKAVSDGTASYVALERKAELYDKLVKGDLSDEEDQEKYCVDFFRKGIEHDELPPLLQPLSHNVLVENEDGAVNDDDSLMFKLKTIGPGRKAGAVDNADYKRNIRYQIYVFVL